jgi:hypothetical protein
MFRIPYNSSNLRRLLNREILVQYKQKLFLSLPKTLFVIERNVICATLANGRVALSPNLLLQRLLKPKWKALSPLASPT